MIIDIWGWVLLVAAMALLFSIGGLVYGVLNRWKLQKIETHQDTIEMKVDHTNNNARAVKQALAYKDAKEEALREAAEGVPIDVTIINSSQEPVPIVPIEDAKK
ncbi:MAG: hypothetical protein H0X01_02685 [Nitrospira sp.]|nr:hypothetical protein [Nitrospira sp.]